MKYLIIGLLIFAGCKEVKQPEYIKVGKDYQIEFLFEYDSCKMYRYNDGNRYVYWSDCRGKTSSDYKVSQVVGKTTTTTEHKVEAITTR